MTDQQQEDQWWLEEDVNWPRSPFPPAPEENEMPRRWRRPAKMVAVGLIAAVLGAVLVYAVSGATSNQMPSASQRRGTGPGSGQRVTVPGGSGRQALPGGTAVMMIGGRVTAVSATSITIGGGGHAVTAAITAATRVTGKVSSSSGIRVGDQVSAQLTQRGGGRITATAIQDPAQLPAGGGPP